MEETAKPKVIITWADEQEPDEVSEDSTRQALEKLVGRGWKKVD
jgi:hypothetical protein